MELHDADPESLPLAFFAARFSFSVLLAAVFELFAPPLSLLAMAAPSVARCPPTLSHDSVEGCGYRDLEEGVVRLNQAASGLWHQGDTDLRQTPRVLS